MYHVKEKGKNCRRREEEVEEEKRRNRRLGRSRKRNCEGGGEGSRKKTRYMWK
jgi:hypothetical protein